MPPVSSIRCWRKKNFEVFLEVKEGEIREDFI